MSKSVPIKLKAPDPVQSFVEAGEEPRASTYREDTPSTAKEPVTRMSLDLPKSLHRRMKLHCVERGVSLSDYLRRLIEKDLT